VHLGFPLEAADEIRLYSGPRGQDFDGYFTAIRVITRSPHFPHAAAAEEAGYSVAR